MNTITKKAVAYICYTNNDGTIQDGSFDDIPMDAFIATITLQTPYINENNELKYKDYQHRIYCGDDIPAEIFIKAYGKTISKEKLSYIKEEVKKGYTTIVIPLSRSLEFAFLTKEDQLCRTRNDFEDIINEFKRQTQNAVDLKSFENETKVNKL